MGQAQILQLLFPVHSHRVVAIVLNPINPKPSTLNRLAASSVPIARIHNSLFRKTTLKPKQLTFEASAGALEGLWGLGVWGRFGLRGFVGPLRDP